MVEYGVSFWLPWISNSLLVNQERSQRCARRAITDQLRTSPVEVIHAEANLPSMKTQAIQLSTIDMEKSLGTTQTIRDTQQRPSGYGNAPISLVGVKKAGDVSEKSSVILSPSRQPHLGPYGLTPAISPFSYPERRRVTLNRTMH